jgi:hypothetical protein
MVYVCSFANHISLYKCPDFTYNPNEFVKVLNTSLHFEHTLNDHIVPDYVVKECELNSLESLSNTVSSYYEYTECKNEHASNIYLNNTLYKNRILDFFNLYLK